MGVPHGVQLPPGVPQADDGRAGSSGGSGPRRTSQPTAIKLTPKSAAKTANRCGRREAGGRLALTSLDPRSILGSPWKL
ncbi:MAG: hypothetical protein NTW86_00140, partial [Candidatus Sumerlaeota bacterium]|nr:hypothetical protein [Candidatus Sumerlaeota bacterium]